MGESGTLTTVTRISQGEKVLSMTGVSVSNTDTSEMSMITLLISLSLGWLSLLKYLAVLKTYSHMIIT
jgi:hypothetical protein